MSDYHLVPANGDDASLGTWSLWRDARKAWEAIRDKRAVRMLCMWPCGCIMQAIRNGPGSKHTGWIRVDRCAEHVFGHTDLARRAFASIGIVVAS